MPPLGSESRLTMVTVSPSKGFWPGPKREPSSSFVVLISIPYSGSDLSVTVPSSCQVTCGVSCATAGPLRTTSTVDSSSALLMAMVSSPCDIAGHCPVSFDPWTRAERNSHSLCQAKSCDDCAALVKRALWRIGLASRPIGGKTAPHRFPARTSRMRAARLLLRLALAVLLLGALPAAAQTQA